MICRALNLAGLAAMAWVALGHAQLAQGNEYDTTAAARTFVQSVYARYQQANPGPQTLWRDAPTLFSSRLLSLIRADQRAAHGESGLLDHDPICSCQDWKDLTVTRIDVSSSAANHATAVVSFTNSGQAFETQLFLVRQVSGWRIDDIRESHVQSLRHFLEHGLAEP